MRDMQLLKEYCYLKLENNLRVTWTVGDLHPFRVVFGRAYRGLTDGFLSLRNFSVAIS